MPINATYEFGLAQEEYQHAETTEERVRALQKMLSTAPSHKGSEKLRDEIKRKLSKARELMKKEKGKRGSGGAFSIKREGDAFVALVGLTNSGKSTLLNWLTRKKIKVSEHSFTTVKPEFGIMNYSGVKIQVVEIPAIVKNYYETENGANFLGVIRMADVIVFVVDMTKNVDQQIKLMQSEMDKNDIVRKTIVIGLKGEMGIGLGEARERVWKSLELMRVYTKDKERKNTGVPVALKKGSNVKDFATRIHKDFIKKFRYAKIWGPSSRFPGQQVGLEHILMDEDMVELFLEK
jgi:small GTP-binding protein